MKKLSRQDFSLPHFRIANTLIKIFIIDIFCKKTISTSTVLNECVERSWKVTVPFHEKNINEKGIFS